MKKQLLLAITLLSLSPFSLNAAQSFENRGEVYNFNRISEKTTFIEVFRTNPDNFQKHEYFYDVSLLLNARCTPTMLQVSFANLKNDINPNNKNDRASVKIGNRTFSSKIYTFIKNRSFFVDIPSNIVYSLNFSGDINLSLDFEEEELQTDLAFELDEEERETIVSKVRECKPT